MQTNVSDLLSSASLLFAAIAMIFSLWYAEIKSGTERAKPATNDGTGTFNREIKNIIQFRALPLCVVSLAIGIIYLPKVIEFVWEAIDYKLSTAQQITFTYSPVKTAFIFIVILIFSMSALLARDISKLHKKKI